MGRFAASLLTFSCLAGMASLTGGCASGHGPEAKELADIKQTLTQIRTENDRLAERIATLEIGRSASAGLGEDGKSPTNLRVIRLGPGLASPDAAQVESAGGETAAASTDDDDPRPQVQATGKRRGKSAHDSASSGANDPDAKRAYESAAVKMGKKDYPGALDAFAAFLVRWPDHPRADSAMFERGECYFAQGEFEHAADEYAGVVARFPAGSKAPDALLKLGLSDDKLGRGGEAKDSFARLAHDFPRSDAARKIPASSSASAPSLSVSPALPSLGSSGESR